jgi:hypothetical protein
VHYCFCMHISLWHVSTHVCVCVCVENNHKEVVERKRVCGFILVTDMSSFSVAQEISHKCTIRYRFHLIIFYLTPSTPRRIVKWIKKQSTECFPSYSNTLIFEFFELFAIHCWFLLLFFLFSFFHLHESSWHSYTHIFFSNECSKRACRRETRNCLRRLVDGER